MSRCDRGPLHLKNPLFVVWIAVDRQFEEVRTLAGAGHVHVTQARPLSEVSVRTSTSCAIFSAGSPRLMRITVPPKFFEDIQGVRTVDLARVTRYLAASRQA